MHLLYYDGGETIFYDTEHNELLCTFALWISKGKTMLIRVHCDGGGGYYI